MVDLGAVRGKRVLLIISGGIAAYKSLELIRRLKEHGAAVRCVLTHGGSHFVTPLSLSALSEDTVYTDLWSLTDESEMGHIRLSREADLLVVAPASADILAKMAAGLADDLATTALLATDKPVMVAPAMNVMMWAHAATRANMAVLESRGIRRVGPNAGDMACGEVGAGRMAEPHQILQEIARFFSPPRELVLSGRRALVTSGPTLEPIDPVRYISNRSSGKQGHAIAAALADIGADTLLVTGPTNQPDPAGVTVIRIETAREMLAACENALPVDVAVCAAAVADWRVKNLRSSKMKKQAGRIPAIEMTENPDILATLSGPGNRRPALVVGFAAETDDLLENAKAKLARKGCDWIVANEVGEATDTFGGEHNAVHLLRAAGRSVTDESWPRMTKEAVAARLAAAIADHVKALPANQNAGLPQ